MNLNPCISLCIYRFTGLFLFIYFGGGGGGCCCGDVCVYVVLHLYVCVYVWEETGEVRIKHVYYLWFVFVFVYAVIQFWDCDCELL